MRKRRRKLSRNLPRPVTGSRRGWETRLPVLTFPVVLGVLHVFLFLGSLAGLLIWRGKSLITMQLLKTAVITKYIFSGFMHLFYCRLMRSQTLGDVSSLEFMRSRRVFEINPEHPIIKDLNVSRSLFSDSILIFFQI